jgi:hypothetical protein
MLAHYRLLECIDSGGMGVVYRAHNTHLDCDVAIKVLPSRALDDSEARRKLKHEAHLLSKLHNPHVAVVHDYDRQDDVDFIVLEYVPGMTLAERVAAGPLHESAALDLGMQLADGLAAVHEAGLVHCDVTPRNIRITPDGRLKLLDFGLSRHVRNRPDGTTSSGSLGGAFGTPPYMAPEMLHEGRFDARVDIYAAGTVLYEMATGRKPFEADVPGRLVQAILHDPPLSPRSVNSRVSAAFEAVILKALDKNPERRYQSARELLVDLDRLRHDAIATSPTRRVPRARRRWLWVAGTAAAGALAALAVVRGPHHDLGPLRATDLVPVVTWPGESFGSRLSPDAQWVSFVARHSGRYGLWLRKLSMAEPRLLHESTATIASHMWSPDGERIALLLDEPEGVYLRCIPSQGGPTLWSLQMEKMFGSAYLVRWVGSKIYLDVTADGLWTLDTSTGTKERLLAATSADGARIDFDVAPGTERVLFTRVKGNHSSLWTCSKNGGDLRPVRDGTADDRALWLDASGTRVVFSAAQDGPSDLWSVEPGGRDPIRLTFGSGVERLEDVALDGSALTFFEQRDASTLWLLPPGPGRRPQRLTSENALDLWPTADDIGDIVFQRSEPAAPDSMLHGARLFRLRLGAGPDAAATPLAARGGEALVSPEGRFVAYLRRDLQAPTGQIWMADLRTEHVWRVAADVVLPSVHVFPVEGRERMTAWRRAGPSLYWVARQGDRRSVCRWQAGSAAEGDSVLVDRGAAWIGDLHVSPDERRIAYVRSARGTPQRHELRCYDLEANRPHMLPERFAENPDRLSLLGWMDSRRLLVARVRANPDWTNHIQLYTLSLDGAEAQLGVVDHVFVGTARLDRPRRTLLMTRAGDDGVHNIHALDFRTRRLDRLTDNELQGVSFSGITLLPGGSILFVQHERNESVWFVRIEGTAITERSGSWLRRIKFPIS